MAKILFTVVPAFGHINPTLPVAVELKRRGHDVGYATGADFQTAITAEGFAFFQAGPPRLRPGGTDTSQGMFKSAGALGQYYFLKLLAEVNEESIDPMRAAVERFRPDVIISDSLTYAGGQMAEYYGLPWASFCSVPSMIPSNDAPPMTPWGLPPSDSRLVKMFYSIIRFWQSRFVLLRVTGLDRRFNLIRSGLGLEPVTGCAVRSAISPYLILSPTCEGFEYPRSDWPPQMHLIGPAAWGKGADNVDTHALFEFLDDDDAPIVYVTLGTLHTYRSHRFYKMVIDAFRDDRLQIVVSVGNAMDMSEFSGAPPNFRFERFVPHSKILPRAAVVVHHGGQGVAQDSILYGVPSVVVPIALDLHEMARRCSVAGVSIRIPFSRVNSKRLRAAVRQILEGGEIRRNTKRLQTIFRSTNAAATGAGLIEQLAGTGMAVINP